MQLVLSLFCFISALYHRRWGCGIYLLSNWQFFLDDLFFQFVVLDAGGTLCLSDSLPEAIAMYMAQSQTLMSTCAAECMRQHLTDCMEFIGDLHTLTKVKVSWPPTGVQNLSPEGVCLILMQSG